MIELTGGLEFIGQLAEMTRVGAMPAGDDFDGTYFTG